MEKGKKVILPKEDVESEKSFGLNSPLQRNDDDENEDDYDESSPNSPSTTFISPKNSKQ